MPPPPPLPDSLLLPPAPPFLLSRSSAFFFFDLFDFFSLFLFEMAPLDVDAEEEEEPAGEDTEECFTLRVRLVAEADDEDALEVVDAGDPGREVDAARLGGRAVAAEVTGAPAGGGCSGTSIFDSEESRSGNFRA